MSPSVINLSDAPLDVITVLLGNMELKQRATCALVCSDWAKAAAATTHSIVKHGLQDLTSLQQWLEKYGSQVRVVRLHAESQLDMSRLPCAQLQDLLLHGQYWSRKLMLDSRVWADIAASTKLTSVSLQRVRTDSQQADVVSALTALPDLQQLTWQEVECGQKQGLSDSRLLQQLTKLTDLRLVAVSKEALQHLGSVSKLQHLSISLAPDWAAADCPGLQQLSALTSLQVTYDLQSLLISVTQLTALQQLKVSAASATELNGLKALTALTKLRATRLKPDPTPLQLPALHSLELGIGPFGNSVVHMSQLCSCTQLRRLSLQQFNLMGLDSLAASSMLQELHFYYCSLSSPEGPAGVDPWQLLFPGPGRLPHSRHWCLCQCLQHPNRQTLSDWWRVAAGCSG